MITTDGGAVLVGDWRRRYGTKTDVHLYNATHGAPAHTKLFADDRPICGKRIKRKDTIAMHRGRPCYQCLVNAITKRDHSKLHLETYP